MQKIFSAPVVGAILFAALSGVATIAASTPQSQPQIARVSSPLVERGRYLVGPAGQCSDCHGNKLQGAPIGLLAPSAPPIVQRSAPQIAGLPMFNDDAEALHFLETGELPGGKHARPPMPKYRYDHADAVAIVTYLKTLR